MNHAIPLSITLVLGSALSHGNTLSAQTWLAIDGKRDVGPTQSISLARSVHAVDFDHDGRTDLLFGSDYRGWWLPAVYRNIGEGRFEPVGEIVHLELHAVADLDGDGTVEVLRSYQPILSLQSDGSLVPTGLQFGRGPSAVGDVDGDGDVDVVSDGELWLQTAPMQFVRSNGLQVAPGSAVRLVDIEGDGDLDVVIARDGAANGLYLNDGTGTFGDASAMLPAEARRTIDCLVRDLDGDGQVDVLFLNRGSDASRLLLRRGGALVDRSGQLSLGVADHVGVASADVDGDGRVDLAIASNPGGVILRGLPGGWFVPSPGLWPGSRENSCVLLEDLDSDGDVDLVEGSRLRSSRLFFNDGSGRFVGPSSSEQVLPLEPTPLREYYALLEDFDGDGDLDVVAPNLFWRNDGFGAFDRVPSNVPPLPRIGALAEARPAAGDIDGDGTIDLVVPSDWNRFRIYRGVGNGQFIASDEYVAPLQPGGGAAGVALSVTTLGLQDLDADGDLDLLCGAAVGTVLGPPAPGRDSLWRNDGTGRFTEDVTAFGAGVGFGKDVAFGDLNGDGRMDFTDGDASFLQRVDGGFDRIERTSFFPRYGTAGGVELADLDGDGALDVIVSNSCQGIPLCEGMENYIGWNDGTGTLQADWLTRFPPANGSLDVTVLDADGDGRPDLFFGDVDTGFHSEGVNTLWRNGGNRTFTLDPADFSQTWSDTYVTLAGDLDGDGDDDVVTLSDSMTRFGEAPQLEIWWNRTRQLVVPDMLRLGRTFTLELHGGIQSGAVLVSPTPAQISAPPFGVLGVRPDAIAWIQPMPTPPSGGRVSSAELAIPNESSLAGLQLVFQGLVIDGSGNVRLTNRIFETFTNH